MLTKGIICSSHFTTAKLWQGGHDITTGIKEQRLGNWSSTSGDKAFNVTLGALCVLTDHDSTLEILAVENSEIHCSYDKSCFFCFMSSTSRASM